MSVGVGAEHVHSDISDTWTNFLSCPVSVRVSQTDRYLCVVSLFGYNRRERILHTIQI